METNVLNPELALEASEGVPDIVATSPEPEPPAAAPMSPAGWFLQPFREPALPAAAVIAGRALILAGGVSMFHHEKSNRMDRKTGQLYFFKAVQELLACFEIHDRFDPLGPLGTLIHPVLNQTLSRLSTGWIKVPVARASRQPRL